MMGTTSRSLLTFTYGTRQAPGQGSEKAKGKFLKGWTDPFALNSWESRACDACQQGVGGHPSAGRMEDRCASIRGKCPLRSRDEGSRKAELLLKTW